MNLTFQSLTTLVAVAFLVAGCEKNQPSSPSVITVSSPGTSAAPAADKWLGKWSGPEGTYLQLNDGGGKYKIIIQNLDGPRTFDGIAAGNQIEFERNGVKESLRATNGAETGMKWLSEKSDCLTVRVGEGYCRD